MRRTLVLTAILAAVTVGAAPTALAAVPTAAVAQPGPTRLVDCGRVSEGDVGPCSAMVQAALNDTGAPYGLTEDGRFGPGTRIALLDFQGRNRLGADGIAGPETLRLLDHVAAVARQGGVASPRPAPLQPCGQRQVRHNGTCLDTGGVVAGGRSAVECADEATRRAVKKILDEETAAGAAKQGARQLGKKLLSVPSIFKCALWDL
ncbi:peptidoglycan-binding domain-containing protein [Pseudonocardia nematodicida]|uniref:Peptidoglycan-binding domain-containing protein n=1 Tax=Pseudonocardia nematodicida TaxID=1206997 RepID=A0ABV1KCY9_9PSEU